MRFHKPANSDKPNPLDVIGKGNTWERFVYRYRDELKSSDGKGVICVVAHDDEWEDEELSFETKESAAASGNLYLRQWFEYLQSDQANFAFSRNLAIVHYTKPKDTEEKKSWWDCDPFVIYVPVFKILMQRSAYFGRMDHPTKCEVFANEEQFGNLMECLLDSEWLETCPEEGKKLAEAKQELDRKLAKAKPDSSEYKTILESTENAARLRSVSSYVLETKHTWGDHVITECQFPETTFMSGEMDLMNKDPFFMHKKVMNVRWVYQDKSRGESERCFVTRWSPEELGFDMWAADTLGSHAEIVAGVKDCTLDQYAAYISALKTIHVDPTGSRPVQLAVMQMRSEGKGAHADAVVAMYRKHIRPKRLNLETKEREDVPPEEVQVPSSHLVRYILFAVDPSRQVAVVLRCNDVGERDAKEWEYMVGHLGKYLNWFLNTRNELKCTDASSRALLFGKV